MKKMFKKLILLSVCLNFLAFNPTNVYAHSLNPKLYQGYSENTRNEGQGFRISDNGEKIAYCYDFNSASPTIKTSNVKTYYEKIPDYLYSNNSSIDKYGIKNKMKIASVLTLGYPLDTYKLMDKYHVTFPQARYVTQLLIWNINKCDDSLSNLPERLTKSKHLLNYYNTILNLVNSKAFTVENFNSGKLEVIGDFKFKKLKNEWRTGILTSSGNVGCFQFSNLPSYMKVVNFNTKKTLDKINVGEKFYIISNKLPSNKTKLNITFQYRFINLHFYKYVNGGKLYDKYTSLQNLIRASVDNKLRSKLLILDLNDAKIIPAKPNDNNIDKPSNHTKPNDNNIDKPSNHTKPNDNNIYKPSKYTKPNNSNIDKPSKHTKPNNNNINKSTKSDTKTPINNYNKNKIISSDSRTRNLPKTGINNIYFEIGILNLLSGLLLIFKNK